jgi:hypothetical protein
MPDDGTDPFNSHREPESAPTDFDTADWRERMQAKYGEIRSQCLRDATPSLTLCKRVHP